jgi:hypothetical protein
MHDEVKTYMKIFNYTELYGTVNSPLSGIYGEAGLLVT